MCRSENQLGRKSLSHSGLQLHAIFHEVLAHHPLWHESLEGIDDAVHHLLPHIVSADINRDTALRHIVALYGADILALLWGEEGELHFRDDGEATIFIYHAHKRVDAPRLIDFITFGACVAEGEEASNIEKVIKEDEKVAEAISALQVLGYSKREIVEALQNVELTSLSVEDIIRKGLANLSKKL